MYVIYINKEGSLEQKKMEKPRIDETSLWKRMIAREDHCSLCLFSRLTGSISFQLAEEHRISQLYMYFYVFHD